jgi:hypothetical protein
MPIVQPCRKHTTKPPHGIPLNHAGGTPAFQDGTVDNGVEYHGGPVLNKPSGTNVYFIWYGNWSGDSSKLILTDFAQRIGGSPYFNINTTYYDYDKGGHQDPVFNKVNYVASVNDNYSMGQSLSDNRVAQLIAGHLGNDLPIDENGVYFVLTSADVNQQEFCVNYCAFHGFLTATFSNGQSFDIKGAWVGNPNQCPAACTVQDPSPNNNPAADSMASFVAHELEESVTDPDGNAWYDSYGNENADLCVWTFGTTKTLPNGSSYNMKLGNRPYMIQQNWVNAKGGYCALLWDGQ